jgi:hypothetical protein
LARNLLDPAGYAVFARFEPASVRFAVYADGKSSPLPTVRGKLLPLEIHFLRGKLHVITNDSLCRDIHIAGSEYSSARSWS